MSKIKLTPVLLLLGALFIIIITANVITLYRCSNENKIICEENFNVIYNDIKSDFLVFNSFSDVTRNVLKNELNNDILLLNATIYENDKTLISFSKKDSANRVNTFSKSFITNRDIYYNVELDYKYLSRLETRTVLIRIALELLILIVIILGIISYEKIDFIKSKLQKKEITQETIEKAQNDFDTFYEQSYVENRPSEEEVIEIKFN